MADFLKPALLLLVSSLVLVEGQLGGRQGKCLCQAEVRRIHPNLITQVDMHPSSLFCSRKEFIVTLKNGTRRCLNSESKFAKFIQAKFKPQEEKRE
uniref:Chemokine ligand 11 n=1 Tax=Plecoglossus altivelis TaxID=61084 RepID=A0A1B0Z5B1_PLEAT|nr:chemokine ligand 11 [Plecoglossus altivelis]